ncbi:hypothetical protein J6590_007321 [Homalodisca vitripennis]|nr:hypothetical protein J6590_007321 [Homalodisca vitripennis]
MHMSDPISSTEASFGHRTSNTLWMILRRYRDVSCGLLGFVLDVMFLYRLINAELDYPDLLEKINFKASFGTRAMSSFTKVAASSSYAANGPMLWIQRLGNNIPSTLDIFIASTSAIKSRLASL